MSRILNDDKGFTIVELILALTMATIMSGVLLMVTFRFYANAVQSQQAAELALESQTLLGQLTEDLRLAVGVQASSTLTDTYNPSGWQTDDATNVLVIASPAVDSDDNIIYNPDTGSPYTNDYIYFLSDGTMYKRILKNESAAGNVANATCPEASATPDCLSDRVFSTHISDIAFVLYDANNSVVADPTLAKSLEMRVDSARTVFGKPVTLSNTTRITQRNY